MARQSAVPPASVVRLLVGPLGVAYALAALAVARGPGEPWTYAGRSSALAALTVAAGLGLVAAGVMLASSRQFGPGGVALAAGFIWFGPFWAGWEGGPPLARSLGMILAGFFLPLVAHLVLAFPYGRLESAAARVLVVAVYGEAALSALGRALFRNPFLDPNCWDNCTTNIFLAHSSPGLAHVLQSADVWFGLGAAAALAALCAQRLTAAKGTARRVRRPVLLAGAALAVATATHSVAVARIPPERPGVASFQLVYAITCAAVIGLALGVAWAVVRAFRQRLALGRIVGEIAGTPEPGTVESALGAALRDPALRIAYWLPVSRRYGDAHGRPVEQPIAAPGGTLTPLARDGMPVAVVAHTGTSAELEREIGATVLLALDNERLDAEVLAQLDDLRASRARIVEKGDAERRRLERDLHDGAQQRLLALSFDVRLARAAAEADGDAGTAVLLGEAVDTVQAALGELRELAHGIHPAILTQAGLAAALATLAETAALPVEIGSTTEGRYPAPAETAAYLTVAEALDDAARRGATHAAVSTAADQHHLTVEVTDDGTERTAELIRLADRIGALGGRLEIRPTTLRAEIPCA